VDPRNVKPLILSSLLVASDSGTRGVGAPRHCWAPGSASLRSGPPPPPRRVEARTEPCNRDSCCRLLHRRCNTLLHPGKRMQGCNLTDPPRRSRSDGCAPWNRWSRASRCIRSPIGSGATPPAWCGGAVPLPEGIAVLSDPAGARTPQEAECAPKGTACALPEPDHWPTGIGPICGPSSASPSSSHASSRAPATRPRGPPAAQAGLEPPQAPAPSPGAWRGSHRPLEAYPVAQFREDAARADALRHHWLPTRPHPGHLRNPGESFEPAPAAVRPPAQREHPPQGVCHFLRHLLGHLRGPVISCPTADRSTTDGLCPTSAAAAPPASGTLPLLRPRA